VATGYMTTTNCADLRRNFKSRGIQCVRQLDVAMAKSTKTARKEGRNLCIVSLTNIEFIIRAYTPRCDAALGTQLCDPVGHWEVV